MLQPELAEQEVRLWWRTAWLMGFAELLLCCCGGDG
jgi:hypothetical protein